MIGFQRLLSVEDPLNIEETLTQMSRSSSFMALKWCRQLFWCEHLIKFLYVSFNLQFGWSNMKFPSLWAGSPDLWLRCHFFCRWNSQNPPPVDLKFSIRPFYRAQLANIAKHDVNICKIGSSWLKWQNKAWNPSPWGPRVRGVRCRVRAGSVCPLGLDWPFPNPS